MREWFAQLLGVIAAVLGLAVIPDAASLGLAAAVLAVAVLAMAIAVVISPYLSRGAPHPIRAIDIGALLSQSDPDAAGHPRPRAPGVAPAA